MTLGARALAALGLGGSLAGLALAASCGGDPIYVYRGQRFDPARGCLEKTSSLDVVEGPTEPKDCPPVCLVQTTLDGARATYVGYTCAPYPAGFDSSGADPSCPRALAAAATREGCVPEAGADAGDAGNDAGDAASDAGDATDATDATDADASTVTRETTWHVERDGQPVVGATVSVLAPAPASTTTDAGGDFKLTLPVGSAVVVKVTPPPAALAAGVMPMIRGLVVADRNRIRTFYLAGPAERQAAVLLGHTPDPAQGLVEVDFRNAAVGGYGAILTSAGAPITPGYGIALDGLGRPASSQTTLAGGAGTTLLLGNVPTSASVAFGATAPAGRACTPCDATPLPVQAGVVTWFDFECGAATDCR